MKQIVILPDTNIWLNELTKNESRELETLKFWISKGVELLVTDIIIEEWERNKEKVLAQYETSLKAQYNAVNRLLKKRLASDYLAHSETLQLKNERQYEIEKLLEEASQMVISDKIWLEVTKLSRANKAPFHNDKNNVNDAALFLSGVQYISEKKNNQLIFLSENYKDFTQGKSTKDRLHPDLIGLAGELDILFYNNIALLIADYEGLPKVELDSYDNRNSTKEIFKYLEKRLNNIPVVSAMHKSLKEIYKEVNFIPPHFFKSIYPFSLSDGEHPSFYNDLHFVTNNPDVLRVFETLKIEDDSISSDDPEIQSQVDDIIEIVKGLNSNLIYSIGERAKDNIQIRYHGPEECNCCICLFNKMKFSESWSASFKKEDDSLKEVFKKAFACYVLKNFKRSYEYLHLVREKSLKEDKKILHYLCSHNLSKIKGQFDWKLGDSEDEINIKKYLESIDLRNEIVQLHFPNYENIRLLNWINDGWYYQQMIYYGNKLLQEIRRYKNSIESGGSGYITSIINLISEYAEFEYFLNRNYVIFHHFLEFEHIHRNFLEALFLAYSIPENASSRLEKFDDYLIHKIIFYCKNKDVINTILEFKIDTLEYNTSSGNGGLQEWLENILADYSNFESLVDKKEIEMKDFHYTYERVLSNLLVFTGIIEFEDNKEREFAQLILEFFKKDKKFKLGGDVYDGFTFYINRKSKFFDHSFLSDLIDLIVYKEEFHRESILGAVNYMITNNHSEFKISDKILTDYIIKICLDECDLCLSTKHDDNSIGVYYQLFSDDAKLRVQIRISDILENEFHSDLYLTAALYDIIDWKNYWDAYIQYCLQSIAEPNKGVFSNNEDDEYPLLSDMINLAYKVGVDLSEKRYAGFRGLSDYFDWLLDMEGFDYTKFKPHWVSLVNTVSYWNRYKQSKALKKCLKEYLSKNRNDTLLKKYFNLYKEGI